MQDEITFKPLAEDDMPLLYQWFQVPHVKEGYARGESYTLEMIGAKYLPRINDTTIQSYIVAYQGKAVGYIQMYKLTDHLPEGVDNYSHPIFNVYQSSEMVGLDLFLADADLLGKGVSSKILQAFLAARVDKKYRAVIVDPAIINKRAIEFFERNGFKKLISSVNANHLLMLRTVATL
jgi:aminoglycoside 6'-N-acetyltransferase